MNPLCFDDENSDTFKKISLKSITTIAMRVLTQLIKFKLIPKHGRAGLRSYVTV